MRGLRRGIRRLGGRYREQAPSHIEPYSKDVSGQHVGGSLLPIAPAQSPPHPSGATPRNFKRQTVPQATVASLYDNDSQAGMAAATP